MNKKMNVSEATVSQIASYIGNVLIGGEWKEALVINGKENSWIGVMSWRDFTNTSFEAWTFFVDPSHRIKNPNDFSESLKKKVLSIRGVSSSTCQYIRRDQHTKRQAIRLTAVWYVKRPLTVYTQGKKEKDGSHEQKASA